jgi:hypothetical protein
MMGVKLKKDRRPRGHIPCFSDAFWYVQRMQRGILQHFGFCSLLFACQAAKTEVARAPAVTIINPTVVPNVVKGDESALLSFSTDGAGTYLVFSDDPVKGALSQGPAASDANTLVTLAGKDLPPGKSRVWISLTPTGGGAASRAFVEIQREIDTCANSQRDADEADVDCGGVCLAKCPMLAACQANPDCVSQRCVDQSCQAIAACSDQRKDGDESDVDCGGSCDVKCALGAQCSGPDDCTTQFCVDGQCTDLPTCNDTQMNGSETGVDCGGTCSRKCALGEGCNKSADCQTYFCNGESRCAQQPTRPALFFTDITAGPSGGGEGDLGAFITIYGKGFRATRGTSTVTIGGVEVARYVQWGEKNTFARELDMIVVQPGSNVVVDAGLLQDLVVTVGGEASNALKFRVNSGRVHFVSKNELSHCAPQQPMMRSCADTGLGNCMNAVDVGSPTRPFATMWQAQCKMQKGDVAYVKSGAYGSDEVLIDLGSDGTGAEPYAMVGYPYSDLGATPTYTQTLGFSAARAWTLAKLSCDHLYTCINNPRNGFRIVGNKFYGQNDGGTFFGNIEVRSALIGLTVYGNHFSGDTFIYESGGMDGLLVSSFDNDSGFFDIGWNEFGYLTNGAAVTLTLASAATPSGLGDFSFHDNLGGNNGLYITRVSGTLPLGPLQCATM